MTRVVWLPLLLLAPAPARGEPPAKPADPAREFVAAHCARCHGPDKQAGGIRLDDLPADPAKDVERWAAVRDQVRDGLMPPAKQPQPDPAKARAVVAWVSEKTGGRAAKMPNQGNLIPHELLFGTPAVATDPPAPRVWRLNPDAYMGFVQSVARGKVSGLVQPFVLVPERGIKDFAGLYAIDEPSTEILIRNAEAVVEVQTAHELKDGKPQGKNGSVREFLALLDPNAEPTAQQLETAVQAQFKMAIGRAATADEVKRFLALYETCAKTGDRPGAAKTMLQAVLLKTDAVYRSELGRGDAGQGRRMLAPDELAVAVSLALSDRRDSALMTAAAKGELRTREQVAAHVRRLLEAPREGDRTRALGFFREYFEYGNATNVFKDRPKTFVHEPRQLVADTDRLILHVLAADKDVFRELLTTPLSFVNYATKQNKQTRKDEPVPGVVLNPINNKGQTGVESVYGVEKWEPRQPVTLPEGTRLGVLMQPSWLVAWSTNFDNDPVRRGRWVRERLLGGNVPDLPIGVVAQVPDDPHRTFRDRLTVTRDAKCWKCHSRMDELGLPFEQFDHFGRVRTAEPVLDVEATAKNIDPKSKKPLGPVHRDAPLVTTGTVADSGDPKLDGPVKDPRELVTKVANSDRARQVFVRHAFRYYLGRNETLSDARTLQDADRAYVEGGGSFKALVVSLLTSDSFLYRSATKPAPGGTK
jgi:cytochrome c553